MSFSVAVQSFAFYILSCSPCHKWHAHRTADREAKRQQKAVAKAHAEALNSSRRSCSGGGGGSNDKCGGGIITEQPALYPQPTVRMTNHWWKEDISLGPRLEKRRRKLLGRTKARTRSASDPATMSGSELGSTTMTSVTRTNTAGLSADAAAASAAGAAAATVPPPVAEWTAGEKRAERRGEQEEAEDVGAARAAASLRQSVAEQQSQQQQQTTPRRNTINTHSSTSSTLLPSHVSLDEDPLTARATAATAAAAAAAEKPRTQTASTYSSTTTAAAAATATATDYSSSTSSQIHPTDKDKWRIGWNHIRYDREDEPLWGRDIGVKAAGQKFKSAWQGSSRRLGELNWTLQPPPHAKIMSGKVPVGKGEC